ncbi:hypothetical protein D3C71_1781030 [compost metagenome]
MFGTAGGGVLAPMPIKGKLLLLSEPPPHAVNVIVSAAAAASEVYANILSFICCLCIFQIHSWMPLCKSP